MRRSDGCVGWAFPKKRQPLIKAWAVPILTIVAFAGARFVATKVRNSAGLRRIPPSLIEEMEASFRSAHPDAPRQVIHVSYDGLILSKEDHGAIPKGTEVHKLVVDYLRGSSGQGHSPVFVWRENSGEWRFVEGQE